MKLPTNKVSFLILLAPARVIADEEGNSWVCSLDRLGVIKTSDEITGFSVEEWFVATGSLAIDSHHRSFIQKSSDDGGLFQGTPAFWDEGGWEVRNSADGKSCRPEKGTDQGDVPFYYCDFTYSDSSAPDIEGKWCFNMASPNDLPPDFTLDIDFFIGVDFRGDPFNGYFDSGPNWGVTNLFIDTTSSYVPAENKIETSLTDISRPEGRKASMYVECLPVEGSCESNGYIFPIGGDEGEEDEMDCCFSGFNTVEVENKGMVAMKNLAIGDMVSIGGNKFSEVYSFGHYHQAANTEYIQIQTSASNQLLEISKVHMVFVEAASVRKAVPASMISVGDSVVLSTGGVATVTNTSVVHRVGAFAPFTKIGTIAVSGVVASSYVALQEGTDVLMIGDLRTPFSLHWLAQASQAPHRIICELTSTYCSKEEYNENGMSTWVSNQLAVSKWLVSQNAWVIGFASIFTVTAAVAVVGMEMVLAYPLVLAISVLTLLTFRKTVLSKSA